MDATGRLVLSFFCFHRKRMTFKPLVFLLLTLAAFTTANAQRVTADTTGRAVTPYYIIATPYHIAITPYYNKVVDSQPDGTLVKAQKSGAYYTYTHAGLNTLRLNGTEGDYVVQTNSDSTVYLKKGIAAVASGWLRLEKTGDTTYVCHTPQAIYSEEGTTYYAVRMTLNADTTSYVVETAANGQPLLDIAFTLKNGELKQQRQDYGEIIGLSNLDGQWYGSGDYAITATPITQKPVTPPTGLAADDFVFKRTNADASTAMSMVKAVIDADSVYLAIPYDGDSTAWIKGITTGDSVTFAPNQYLGYGHRSGCHLFFFPGSYSIETDKNGTKDFFVTMSLHRGALAFNPQTRSITASPGCCWIINAGNKEIYYTALYAAPALYKFNEVAATPADPVVNSYSPFDDGTGAYVNVTIPSEDVNGEYLNTAKLYYNIFTDGDIRPETFYKDDYSHMDTDELTDIPWNYADGWDFYSQGETKGIYLYTARLDSIGFQSTYTGGGEQRKSHIVWYAVSTSAVKDVSTSSTGSAANAWYDLGGRRVDRPQARGIYIRKTTGADGRPKVVKIARQLIKNFLFSQLFFLILQS